MRAADLDVTFILDPIIPPDEVWWLVADPRAVYVGRSVWPRLQENLDRERLIQLQVD